VATLTTSEGQPRRLMIVNSWVIRRWRTSKGVTGLERVQPSSSLGNTLESNCSIFTGTAEKLKRGCVPQGRATKRINPLGRKKPTRGAVSYQFRRW
jgi:hypothetical protein